MISYMRSEGFGASLVAPKLPKGIQPRGQKFVAKRIKDDGRIGWKALSTLEAAVAYQEKKHQQRGMQMRGLQMRGIQRSL